VSRLPALAFSYLHGLVTRVRQLSPRARLALRLGFFALIVALFALALRGRWGAVRDSLSDLSWLSLTAATLLGFSNIFTAMMSWRTLLRDLGSPLTIRAAARIFYLGQLGKYLPGSVWTVVAQAELGRDYNVPARRTVASSVVSTGVSLALGLILAAFTMPYASPGALVHYWWLLLFLPLFVVGLLPRNVDRLTHFFLRVLRREPPDHEFTWRGAARAAGWQLTGWAAIGLQTYVVSLALGAAPAGRTFALAMGGTALAWTAGFLAVPVPAGAGVREAVLIASLSPVLHPASALVVALISRAVATLGDGVFAGSAFLASRGRLRDYGGLAAEVRPVAPDGPVGAEHR
jgi:glycosyltransferase 2 family protein